LGFAIDHRVTPRILSVMVVLLDLYAARGGLDAVIFSFLL
jgi:hypothetical protein